MLSEFGLALGYHTLELLRICFMIVRMLLGSVCAGRRHVHGKNHRYECISGFSTESQQ